MNDISKNEDFLGCVWRFGLAPLCLHCQRKSFCYISLSLSLHLVSLDAYPCELLHRAHYALHPPATLLTTRTHRSRVGEAHTGRQSTRGAVLRRGHSGRCAVGSDGVLRPVAGQAAQQVEPAA
jgi:hypothetical protein